MICGDVLRRLLRRDAETLNKILPPQHPMPPEPVFDPAQPPHDPTAIPDAEDAV